jgi:predicted nucleotidyltransferase
LQVCFETEPLLQILVPSVPALALLKIISWDDGYPHRERDAHDIFFILENYHLIVSENLYEPPAFLLEAEGFDLSVATVRLLGREIADLCSTVTKETIEIILDRETDENGKFRMLGQIGSAGSFKTDKFENSLQLMKKLLQGIREGSPGA